MLIQQVYASLWVGQNCSFLPPTHPHGTDRGKGHNASRPHTLPLCDSLIRQHCSKSPKNRSQRAQNLSPFWPGLSLSSQMEQNSWQWHTLCTFSHTSNALFSQDHEMLRAAAFSAEIKSVRHRSHWRWEVGGFWHTIPNALSNFVSQFLTLADLIVLHLPLLLAIWAKSS